VWSAAINRPSYTRLLSSADHGHWELQADIPVSSVDVEVCGEICGQQKINISIARLKYPAGIHLGTSIYLGRDIARASVEAYRGHGAFDLEIPVANLDTNCPRIPRASILPFSVCMVSLPWAPFTKTDPLPERMSISEPTGILSSRITEGWLKPVVH